MMARFANGLMAGVGLFLALMFSVAQLAPVGVWQHLGTGGAMPDPREGQACAFYGNSIFVHGGRGGIKTWYNSMHILELDSLKWRTVSISEKTIVPRGGHSMNSVNDKFYIFGGRLDVFYRSNDMITFDPATDWYKVLETRGTKPSPRQSHSAVVINNKIFIYGGFDGNKRFSDLHVFDTDRNEWTQHATRGTSPGELEGHQAVVVGTKMYMFGGFTGRNFVGDVYVLDTETMNWTIANSQGNPRAFHSATRIGSYIYVFGGIAREKLNDVKVFDIETQKWIEANTSGGVISPRQGHCAVLAHRTHQLFVFGGFAGWTTYYNDLWLLDATINAKHTTAISSAKDPDGRATQIELANKVDDSLNKANLLLKTDNTETTDKETDNALLPEPEEVLASDPLLNIKDKINLWTQISVLHQSLRQDQQESLKNLSIDLSNLMSLQSHTQQERLALKAQMQQQTDELSNLRQKFKDSEEKVTDLAKRKADAMASQTQLSERIADAQKALDDIKTQQSSKKSTSERAESIRIDLEKRLNSLKTQRDRNFKTYDEAQLKRKDFENSLQNVRTQITGLTSQETALQIQSNEMAESANDLQRRLTRLLELNSDVETLKRKYDASRKALEEYKNTKAAVLGKIQEEIPSSKPSAASLQLPEDDIFSDDMLPQFTQQMQNTLNEKQANRSRTEAKIKETQQQRSRLKDREAELIIDLNSAIDQINLFGAERFSKDQEIASLEAQLLKAIANTERESNELNQIAEKIPKRVAQVEEARANLTLNENTIIEIQSQESNARNELDKLYISLSSKHEELLSTVNRFAEKNTALESIRRQIVSQRKSYESKHSATTQSRQQLRDLVLQAESELRTKVANLEAQLAQLRAQLGQ